MINNITKKRLKELINYDKHKGLFTWRVSKGRMRMGDIAGTTSEYGYIIIIIDGRKYRAHYLAHIYVTGMLPLGEIDHINHIKDDNRWHNLRSVTKKENLKNKSKHKNNKSGTNGVYWSRQNRRWQSQIMVNRKNIHLGSFLEIADAIKIRKEAETIYGFHKNHGK